MSHATSLKALLGDLRFIIERKTWAVLVVFALGVVEPMTAPTASVKVATLLLYGAAEG